MMAIVVGFHCDVITGITVSLAAGSRWRDLLKVDIHFEASCSTV